MRISKIDVFQVDLPYSGGVYALSGGRSFTTFDATIVCISTDCGLQGWGESTPFGATYVAAHALGVRAGINEMAPHLLGQDPRCVDRINHLMDSVLRGHPHAKAAIDVACWDIFGKACGMPVCDLLGGSSQQRMPLISSIYAGEPDDMRARVEQHRQAGYMGHSIKVGADDIDGGPSFDAERVRASLADARSGEFYIVDANGGMTVEQASRFLRLIPNNLDFVFEAPCATWRETLSLRSRCRVPIFFDELADSDTAVANIVAQDAADGVGLKISKNGGLTQCRRQRDICLSAGLAMSVQDTVGSEIAFAAVVHLAQSIPPHSLRCVLDTRDMVSISTAEFDCKVENGGVVAPPQAGLGLQPDLAVLGEPSMAFV